MSNKIEVAVLTLITAVGIILMATVVMNPSFLQGKNDAPTVTMIGEYNDTKEEYSITYSGTFRSDVVYFDADVTVRHNGDVKTWNGETRRQTIPVGSEHTVNITDETEPVVVTFHHEVHGNTTETLRI